MQKRKLLNSFLSIGRYDQFLNHLIYLAKNQASSYVCISNVHMLIEAYNNPRFNKILNGADIAAPDGMPLAKCLSWFYRIKQDRVAGMDLMPSLMKKAEEESMSIYLYGSTDEVLEKIIERARVEFPSLKLAGSYSPPFRTLTEDEKADVVSRINKTKADFVLVSLGCPKQEYWMAEHKNKVNSCMIGIGGAFPVYAQLQKRAPQWMQKISLEWFYRLIQEPQRLWKRYLTTNSKFVLLVIVFYLQIIQRKLKYKLN